MAQASPPYDQNIPVPQLDLHRYIQEIGELNDYYLHNPSAGGSFNDRMRRRNAEIRARFATLRSERQPLLTAHQRYIYEEVSCKNNHSGGHKSCPGTREFGTGYEIVPASIGNDGSGFHTRVYIATPSSFAWNQRRTGEGTNYGHVWGTAHYAASYVQRLLDNEADALRTELRAQHLPDDRSVDPTGA